MTLQNILEKATELLNIDVDFSQSGEEQTLLIGCGREVLNRLVEEYVDIKNEKSITTIDKTISYASLGSILNPVKRVISVSKDGEKRKFTEFKTYIKVAEDGYYDVVYSELMPSLNLSSTIILPPKYTVSILSCGVASAYCLRKGLLDEAQIYETRFINALNNLTQPVRSIVIGER